MTKEEKYLLELIKVHVNEKANNATANKIRLEKVHSDIEFTPEFWQGQYQAFTEVYSMLLNIERTI